MSGRILIFARSLPMHKLGGMEQMSWDLACALAGLGAPVSLITTACPGRPAVFREAGVEVAALAGTRPGRYSRHWWVASRRYLAAQAVADVAAVLSVSAAGFGLLRLKPKFRRSRFVMQAHGTSWDEIRSKFRSRAPRALLSSLRNLAWLPRDMLAYRGFDSVVAVGEAVLETLSRPPLTAVLPACRRRLIHNGIDTEIFAPDATAGAALRARLGVPEDAPVILSASRLHAQKGGAAALAAFARYAARVPAARYWIAGDGPEEAALRALADRLGLAGRVSFLGRLARHELAQHLQAADAFLYLGRRVEVGLPLNVLEALACGLAAVLSDHLATPIPGLWPTPPADAGLAATRLGQAVAAAAAAAARVSLLPPQFALPHCAQSWLDLLTADGPA